MSKKKNTLIDFEKHRKESYLTCPDDCWCWFFEIKLLKGGK